MEHYTSWLTFYSILFFTCVVGMIELLPEFDNLINYQGNAGIVFRSAVTLLYFGLLTGLVYSMFKILKFNAHTKKYLHNSLVIAGRKYVYNITWVRLENHP